MKKNIWGLLFAGISAVAGIVVILKMNGANQGQTTNVFPPLNSSSGTPQIATAADTDTAQSPDISTSTQGVSRLPVQPVWTV